LVAAKLQVLAANKQENLAIYLHNVKFTHILSNLFTVTYTHFIFLAQYTKCRIYMGGFWWVDLLFVSDALVLHRR